MTRANSRKYAPQSGDRAERSRLAEIFGLMRRLNEAAIGDPTIGATSHDPVGLRDLLTMAALEVSHAAGGQRYHWVELGPEPTKTCHMLERLARLGVAPASYTAVDINPESAETMRAGVSRILPDALVRPLTVDYDTIGAADLALDAAPMVITHLGFQEGNDTPANTRARLMRLTRPGDLVLSEMQVVADGALGGIGAFYALPEMRRFSELTARSVTRATLADYAHFVVPVDLAESPPVLAAVCAHEVDRDARGRADRTQADEAPLPAWVLTNVCIKLSDRQFRRIREEGGHFEVLWQGLTGDRTIAIQLSRRL
ncbi:L-histidine N(alpha)-methyltransferase [Salinarimonas chemoclinalis]|uniref:L-histidine N(alpha)-methyltransferase n=1 Tax=Salinarimonas chemoclinalis TaxID=3241599 RepID=UPI0035565973